MGMTVWQVLLAAMATITMAMAQIREAQAQPAQLAPITNDDLCCPCPYAVKWYGIYVKKVQGRSLPQCRKGVGCVGAQLCCPVENKYGQSQGMSCIPKGIAVPCPEPEPPRRSCCPSPDGVKRFLALVGNNFRDCNSQDDCPTDELCCRLGNGAGVCIPPSHQEDNCCCPTDVQCGDRPGTTDLVKCKSDEDCPSHQRCCDGENCPAQVCVDAVPCPCDDPTVKSVGHCLCRGDPHCRSFDGNWWHFHGACNYVFTRDVCTADGLPAGTPNFEVVTKQFRPNSPTWAYIRDVTINFPGLPLTVTLQENGDVLVNGLVTPAGVGGVVPTGFAAVSVIKGVSVNGLYAPSYGLVSVELSNNLGRPWNLDVKVSCKLRGKLCGQCGDFNDDQGNDQTVGPAAGSCPLSPPGPFPAPGSLTGDEDVFGMTWLHSMDLSDPDCNCDWPASRRRKRRSVSQDDGAQKCRAFVAQSSLLQECMKVLGESEITEILDESCGFDVAHDPEYGDWPCSYAQLMAELCAERGLELDGRWQKETGCK